MWPRSRPRRSRPLAAAYAQDTERLKNLAVPPADIPASRPLDLRADMAEPSVRDRAASAAEDALSNVKSIFHAVLPK